MSKFPFMPFYTADYLQDTRHLSCSEKGIYTDLMCFAWGTQEPLPLDERKLCGLCNARSSDEIEALRRVLAEFFVRTDAGYFQSRVEKELAKARSVSELRSHAAIARWRKAKGNPDDAHAMHMHSTSNAHGVTVNQQLQPQLQLQPQGIGGVSNDTPLVPVAPRRRPKAVPDCPYDDLIAAYHDHCPTLPRVEVVNEVRKARLRARWREVAAEHLDDADPRAATLDWFTFFFRDRVDASPFLTGKVKDWHATFDWLLNPTNFAKVVEGQYLRDKEAAR